MEDSNNQNILMKIKENHMAYVKPVTEVIQILTEGVLALSNLENPEEGEETEW